MKAIILARVSSKEQEDNNSIPSQTRRLKEYCNRLNLELVEIYQLVESSTKANRRKFTELIAQVNKSPEIVALVVDTVDRLQRDFRESVLLNELRVSGKIELHFVREGLIINQQSNSSEIMRWDMGVMFAKSYVTQLSDNVKRSLEQKWKDGEWAGKAPFGYRNIDKPDGKKWIIPQSAEAAAVADIFKWYATGAYSMRDIKDKLLEEHGITKTLGSIDKILKNHFYYGVMRIKGQSFAHHYEALVSRPLFEAAQSAASRFKKQPFKYAGLPYYYRGLIACGTCGCRITPERAKGHVYYHCTQYKGKHGAAYIREEELTECFAEAFRAIRPTQEQYDEVMDALKSSHADKIAYKTRQTAQLQAELTKIENRTSRLFDSYLDGDISKDIYRAKNEELKQQQFSINRKLESLDGANDEFYANAQRVMNLVRNEAALFESSELEEKRRLINLVLQNLEIHDRELRWKYKKPFDLMASYTNCSSWLNFVFQIGTP